MRVPMLLPLAIIAISASCSEKKAPTATQTSKPYPGQDRSYDTGYGSGYGTGTGTGSSGYGTTSNIEVVSSSGPSLLATIGQQTMWTFTGRSSDGSIQPSSVTLNANIIPQIPSMIVTGQGTSTITITWTPQLNDAQTGSTGQIDIRASSMSNSSATGLGNFRWTMNPNGGLGGYGNGLGGFGNGLGGGAGLIGLLPVLLNAFQNGGDVGDVFSSLLNGVGTGGLGGNPFGNYGQPGYGVGGAGFGGIGAGGYNYNGFNNWGGIGQGQFGQGQFGQGYNGQGQFGQGYNGQGQFGQGYNGQGQFGQGYNGQGGVGQGSFGQGGSGW